MRSKARKILFIETVYEDGFESSFEHIYSIPPIDDWSGATVVDYFDDNATKVFCDLNRIGEKPRDGHVYKFMIPCPPEVAEIYLCKADNNGTVYVFTDADLTSLLSNGYIWKVR